MIKKKEIILLFIALSILICLLLFYFIFFKDIKKNSDDIEITNIKQVSTNGIAETLKQNIDDSNHSINLESSFANPSDYVEYKVTIKNNSKKAVYISNIKKDITQEKYKDFINIEVKGYTKGEAINALDSRTIIIKIEYLDQINNDNDSLDINTKISLSFKPVDNKKKYLVSYNCILNTKSKCDDLNEYKSTGDTVFSDKKDDNVNIPHIKGYKFKGFANTMGVRLTDEKGILLNSKKNIVVKHSNINIIALFDKITIPVINHVNTSSLTKNTLTVLVDASAFDNKKISTYKFKINNEEYINNGNNPSYTFNDLKSNKKYNISVMACDNAGLCTKKSIEATTNDKEKPILKFDKNDSSKLTITYDYNDNNEYLYTINDEIFIYNKNNGKFIKDNQDNDDSNSYIITKIKNNKLIVSFRLTNASDKVIAKIRYNDKENVKEVSSTTIYTPSPVIKSYSCDNLSADFRDTNYIDKIANINFGIYTNINDYESSALKIWDISEKQDKSVIAILSYASDNLYYNLDIKGYLNKVVGNKDSSYLFSEMTNLISINFNNSFDTSKVTNMSYMFAGNNNNPLSNFSSITGISTFNTSNVTNMSNMFAYNSNIPSLDLSNFDTKKVTDFSSMFIGCMSLQKLDVSSFDLKKATNISKMFKDNKSINIIKGIESFKTTNVKSMNNLFDGCNNLITLNLCNFDTRKIKSSKALFRNTLSLKNVYVSSKWIINDSSNNFNHSSIKKVTKTSDKLCNETADALLLDINTKVQKKSLYISVDASAKSGIAKYFYKLSKDDNYKKVNKNEFVINNLSSGKYTIYVKVTTYYGNIKVITKDIVIK